MRGVKDFLQENLQAMVDYILVVSTPTPAAYPPTSSPVSGHQRLQVVDSLRQRGASMSTLHREAIPLLPHGLDVPRRLACISSALVRSARSADQKTVPIDQGDRLYDLFIKCANIEETGLQRVSQSAVRPTHLVGCNSEHLHEKPQSSPYLVSPWRNRKRTATRPSTAPSLDPIAHNYSFQNASPRTPSTLPSSLRRGSLPDLYPRRPLREISPSIGFPRFLRRNAVSTDSIAAFLPRGGNSHHPTSLHTTSLEAQQKSLPTSEETGKKKKSILTGMFPLR